MKLELMVKIELFRRYEELKVIMMINSKTFKSLAESILQKQFFRALEIQDD